MHKKTSYGQNKIDRKTSLEQNVRAKITSIDPRELLLLFVAIAIILFRYYESIPNVSDGQIVRLSGRVATEPNYYERTQSIELNGFRFYLPSYPLIYYGDKIVVTGEISGDEIHGPTLVKHTPNTGVIFRLRKDLLTFYQKNLPIPHSSLVSGMVLGSKAGIPNSFWEDLKSTGTAHVVVASGMNVTLVATFLISILIIFISRKRAVVLALIGIWIYTVLAGFDAPVVRAAVMGSIGFGAQAMGRLNVAWRGLIISALLMLLVKPQWLTDLGFLLSFTATASLMLLELPIRKRLVRLPNIIKQDLSTSLAAQVGVAPILLFAFGQFNPLSPFINAILLWTVAPITIIAGLAGLLSLFYDPVGRFTLYLTYPLTTWFIGVVEMFT